MEKRGTQRRGRAGGQTPRGPPLTGAMHPVSQLHWWCRKGWEGGKTEREREQRRALSSRSSCRRQEGRASRRGPKARAIRCQKRSTESGTQQAWPSVGTVGVPVGMR